MTEEWQMAKFAQSDGRRIIASVKILPKFFGQKPSQLSSE